MRGLTRASLALLAIAFAALLLGAGCGGGDEEAEEPTGAGGQETTEAAGGGKAVKLAVFLASSANTYWQASLEGAREAAGKLGNVDITVFDAQFDTNRQKSQLQDALASGRFDAWYIGPNDGTAIVPEIKQAIDKGVKVGCSLVPCGPDVRETDVQVDGMVVQMGIGFFEDGKDLGDLTVQACKGKNPCQVAWIPGLPSLPLEKARTDGLKEVLAENDNIKIVAEQPGEYLAAPALRPTQNILQANPEVDVVVSSGDQMIVGAEKAVRQAGKAGDIALIGGGATVDGVKAIKEGRWFGSTVYVPKTEGRVVTEHLVRAVRGDDIEGKSIDPLDYSKAGRVVTKKNAGKFKPEFQG